MKSFIVCCDFRGDIESESAAAGVLNRYVGVRIKPDTWVISADVTSALLHRELDSKGFYVFIAEIGGGCRMTQPESIISWFRKNQNVIL